MKAFSVYLLAAMFAVSGLFAQQGKSDSVEQSEMYRPAFHYTPASGWMNDPNGMVFANGKYHLFYQYYPKDIVWGPMHWGHAESPDLLHWKRLPIALYPDSLGWIFSGSAVIDKENSAGFGKNAMVAIFTYHNDEIWKQGKKNTESQGLAYSLNEGKTWKKYERNPVLNNAGEQDFRDPKVFWNDAQHAWNMVLAVGNVIRIFSSPNLKEWKRESDFKPAITDFGVLECPDLFPMRVGKETKWVMIISQNLNAPNGGSGTRYFVGDFDGKHFSNVTNHEWFDYGKDFYAAVTFSNVGAGKRILLGWMSNWQYADKTPTYAWRSAMTLPRELELVKDNGTYYVQQKVIEQFSPLTKPVFTSRSAKLPFQSPTMDFAQSAIAFETDTTITDIRIEFFNAVGDVLVVEMNNHRLNIDRSKSGKVGFSPQFGDTVQTMPLKGAVRNFQMFLDHSSIEILLNNGRYSMTNQFFANKNFENLRVTSTTVKNIQNVRINIVRNVWTKR
jgi:fructan beta-fructosidase